MSAIACMRNGDVIIDKHMRHTYEVVRVGFDDAVAERLDDPRKTQRTFKARTLEQVETGLWQETISAR